jgi:hypothetical protein
MTAILTPLLQHIFLAPQSNAGKAHKKRDIGRAKPDVADSIRGLWQYVSYRPIPLGRGAPRLRS